MTSRSASRIPDDSNWKTPIASPRASIAYVFAVVERDRADVDPADELDRLVDHVEVAQAEEVHLEQAERLDVAHRELRHHLLVGALLLQRDDLDQRLRPDHDARRVDRVGRASPSSGRARSTISFATGSVSYAVFRSGPAQALLERLPGAFGDQLREPVDDAVRDLQHAARVADGGAGGHRPEGDDLGDAVAAVLLGHVVDHPLAALDGEVDVDVGHRLAAGLRKRSKRRS